MTIHTRMMGCMDLKVRNKEEGVACCELLCVIVRMHNMRKLIEKQGTSYQIYHDKVRWYVWVN